MNGFNDEQILELRSGVASFDAKYNTLAVLAKNMAETRGATTPEVQEAFFKAGYTKENLVDAVTLVGEITITNYLHRTTEVAVDFPTVAV